MIAITGASGFIGNYVAKYLSENLVEDPLRLLLVDTSFENCNTEGIKAWDSCSPQQFLSFMQDQPHRIEAVIHLGAVTDTMCTDEDLLRDLNINFTKKLWALCSNFNKPLIYASSASTYGDGSLGYDDQMENLKDLRPLNLYASSKQEIDLFAQYGLLKESLHRIGASPLSPYRWYGLKFFNVYGPGEDHKGRMASVVHHGKREIQETGKIQLFRSYREGVADGEQARDFIYVRDIAKVIQWLLMSPAPSGIYNLGTGKARTFLDLAKGVFSALEREPVIEFKEMPLELRDKYQYFTEARMEKLRRAGYTEEFYSLEEGIKETFKEESR